MRVGSRDGLLRDYADRVEEKILAEFRTQGAGVDGVCVRGLACLGWYQ